MVDYEGLSPAERFAKAKVRRSQPSLDDFRALLEFPLDDFQERACEALARGSGVLVAAPTGAGKTVVGEFAVHLAIASKQRVFYTTPIKALSNQKYLDLSARYGFERVGLLTGDSNTNGGADIVVMTTEVLRNMLYLNSAALINLGYVVMDEVHYLADRFRGAVWEEVILHLPKDVRVVSLSATVSNAEEFGAWLAEVRGDTAVIVSEHRPVPLNQHVLFGDELIELFAGDGRNQRVNPDLVERHNAKLRLPGGRSNAARRGFGGQPPNRGNFRHQHPRMQHGFNRIEKASKPEVVEILDDAQLLPAIFFIFSRAGCEAAVKACLQRGVRLTSSAERAEIREIVEQKCSDISDEDLNTLGYFEWLEALERGVAAHHAGMLPAFKEVVEELFLKKLVRCVFATETLSLGINMPARTVVLERLDKFNGEQRVQITPGEYTQLTGRAGRRGIDVDGHSVIQWSANLDPLLVAGLASKRTYPLMSSFRPTYNMAINLIEAYGRERSRQVLETSFAQFQADRSVVGLARGIQEKLKTLEGYAEAMKCHLGDFADYAQMRRDISDLERLLSGGRTRESRGKDIRQSRGRHQQEQELAELKRRIKRHACHSCAEREAHSRWAERWHKLAREVQGQQQGIESRTNQVAQRFDRICELLEELGYVVAQRELDDFGIPELEVADSGRVLGKIYGERDLLVAEALRRGYWDELDPPGLAAMMAALLYEPRREDEGKEWRLPKGNFQEVFARTEALWQELEVLSRGHRLPADGPLELALCTPIHRWATGSRLDTVLSLADMLPGDFIRNCKQIIDLLEQISQVGSSALADRARRAIEMVKRGIVAHSYFD